MTFSFANVAFLLLLMVFALYALAAIRVREIALLAAARHCRDMEVQLLDQSIGTRSLWLKRDKHGVPRVWRRYQFEFTSTGEQRYHGQVITLGRTVETVQLETHRMNLH